MARAIAALPAGTRLTNYISLGVITKSFPIKQVRAILAATGKTSVRQRELPAHVVVYDVMAPALYMQASYREVLRCLLEGIQWLLEPSAPVQVAGKSGISPACMRPGWAALQKLPDAVVQPLAVPATRGAWYRGWRLVSLDGSTRDVADEEANAAAFGRPGRSRGVSAYPQLRFVWLVANGTHVLCASQMAGCRGGEITLAQAVLPSLRPDMLCWADRQFFGFKLWQQARAGGAELLWRIKKNMRLACEQRLPDGSYWRRSYPSERDWRQRTHGVRVRVIDYRWAGVVDAEPLYRLVTTILDPHQAPATELAALYHERWESETALDELKTHLRSAQIVWRSKTPALVRQEFDGLLMAHFAIRSLMPEAALSADPDPDQLSFVHAVRVVRRKLPAYGAIPPPKRSAFHDRVLAELLQEQVVSSRNRRNPRGVKRKMSNFPLRRKGYKPLPPLDITNAVRIH